MSNVCGGPALPMRYPFRGEVRVTLGRYENYGRVLDREGHFRGHRRRCKAPLRVCPSVRVCIDRDPCPIGPNATESLKVATNVASRFPPLVTKSCIL
jgi:hypothetical protein